METPWQCLSDVLATATNTTHRNKQTGDTHAMADTFEYKILVSDADDETDEGTLNTHGAQGWELVSAVADVRANEDSDGGGDGEDDDNVPVTVFYFKKRTTG